MSLVLVSDASLQQRLQLLLDLTNNLVANLDIRDVLKREVAVSRSAVSRRFVALSAGVVRRYLSRPLGELPLRVILIDGIIFHDHTILIALGITADGHKIVLGVREGATENAGMAKALLRDLIERGLSTEEAILFVIDGAKALRSAITDIFGQLALIQRCQVHKERNVLDHLPDTLKLGTRRALRDAYRCSDATLAERQLERLACSLERDHPGAAASVREGLTDTLTLHRLAINGALSARCDRPIPSRTSTGRSLSSRITCAAGATAR